MFRNALFVPAFAAISIVSGDVLSLTLSSTDVASGGSVTGTVTVSGRVFGTTRVSLASSNPAVAKVPTTVSVGRLGRATFNVGTAVGAAGCPHISARVGTTPPVSEILFVQAPSTSGMGITLNPSSTVGGASVAGRVAVISPGTNLTVLLSSSNPTVTVPASVQLSPEEAGNYAGRFTIQTQTVAPSTCSVITATHGSSKVRKLLKVYTVGG